jgi:hypothetical protein
MPVVSDAMSAPANGDHQGMPPMVADLASTGGPPPSAAPPGI